MSMPYYNNGLRYFHPSTNSFSLLPTPNGFMTPIYLDTYNQFQNYSSMRRIIYLNNSRHGTQRNYRNRGNLKQINNDVPKLTEDLESSSSVNSASKIPSKEASLPNNADISEGDKISSILPNAENVMDPETEEFCAGSLNDSLVILAVDPPKEEIVITLSDTEGDADSELSKVCTSKAEQSQSISVRDKENISCLKKKKKNKKKREVPPEEVNLPNNVNMSKENNNEGDKISFISPNAENVMDPGIEEFCSDIVDDSIRILAVDPPKQEKEKITITLPDTEDNTESDFNFRLSALFELAKVFSNKAEQSESITVKGKEKTSCLKKKKIKKKIKCKNNIQKVNSFIQDEEKIVITLSDSEDIADSEQSNVCSTKANVSGNIVEKKRKKSSYLKKKNENRVKNKKNILPRKSQRNLSPKTVTKKLKSALKKIKEKNQEVSLQEVSLSCQKDFSEGESISVNLTDAENLINLEIDQFNSKNANSVVMNPEVNLSNQDENIIVTLSDTEDITDSKLPRVCPSVVKGSANVAVKCKNKRRAKKRCKNKTKNKENILQNKSQEELVLKKVNKKSKVFKKLKEKLKKKKALRLKCVKVLHSLSVRYRRPVVIDGSNVAITHGLPSHTFSAKGIQLCVDFFLKRGHTQITAFVPMFRMNDCSDHPFPTVGQEILKDLAEKQHVVFTPSRDVNGKLIISYDDRFIVELASKCGGIIVSNDNYQDLIHESESFRETIEKRLLMFVFVGDLFMIPDDPLGKRGPKLEEFLHF